MKIKILFLVFIAFLFQIDSVEVEKKRPTPKPRVLSSREIAAKVLPSVVLIITQDENGNPISQGSGFVYKPGLVVSNLHVFERATNAVVKNVKTGEISKAIEVVGMNARQDICIIRIDNAKFPVLPSGDSFAVKTGDDVYVASNPKGLEGSFTKGIISSVRERDRKEKGDDELLNWVKNISGETDRTLFQIDAAISSGSSGGALINSRGQVIGVARSSVVSGQNLNFAIPIDQLLTLERKFKHPILLAGACAYSDRLKLKLLGPVKLVKEGNYRANGSIEARSIREFDAFGNNTRYFYYWVSDSTKTSETVREFDENGLIISVRFSSNGDKDGSYDLPFTEGIRKKMNSRKFSGTLVNDDYFEISKFAAIDSSSVFDSYGNETMNIQVSGDRRWVTTFEYDSNGRLTKVYEPVGDKIYALRLSYNLDKYGNWIEQKREIQYVPGGDWDNPFRNVVREIEYFN